MPHITTDKIFSKKDLDDACAKTAEIKDAFWISWIEKQGFHLLNQTTGRYYPLEESPGWESLKEKEEVK